MGSIKARVCESFALCAFRSLPSCLRSFGGWVGRVAAAVGAYLVGGAKSQSPVWLPIYSISETSMVLQAGDPRCSPLSEDAALALSASYNVRHWGIAGDFSRRSPLIASTHHR